MNRILVTTDLSANSKAAMRFAINLASQKKVELIFMHVHNVLRASTWNDATYDYYVSEDRENVMKELTSLVASVYKAMEVKPGKYRCEVYHQFGTIDAIEEYAKTNECDYICIATRGAGTLKKLFGTNTSALIKKSAVPVICVPKTYRVKPITKLLYTSDMTNYEAELAKVIAFAKPMKAEIELLHLSFPYEQLASKQVAEKDLKKKVRYDVSIHYETRDLDNSLMTDLEKAVKKAKPSLVVMFTQQDRSLFDRIFLGSAAEEFSYTTNLPLLTFRKG